MISLENEALQFIEKSKSQGTTQTEICIDEVEETKTVYEQTDFSVSTSNRVTTFGVRALVGNRLGFITTNSLDKEKTSSAIKEVQNLAKMSPQNTNYKFAENSQGAFELYDSRLADLGPKDILEYSQFFIDECRKDPRILIDRAEMSLSSSSRFILNSQNVHVRAKQSLCGWYVMGMATEKGEVTSFDYDGSSVAQLDNLKEEMRLTAEAFRESVLGSLGGFGCKSYQGDVLLHPAAVGDLLASVISFNVNGRAQQDGMSKWREAFDAIVASEKLSVIENPLDQTKPGSWTPFDREGVKTRAQDIIRNGRLKMTAHNMFSASRAGTSSTGHASGGSRSLPGIGLHALEFLPGEASQNDLYSALNTGLVLKRFSGNADPVSGNFSGVAKNSWWVEGGKRKHALKEVMVSGNMFDLLKNIKLIGKKVFRQSGSFDSPYILVQGVSVTSA